MSATPSPDDPEGDRMVSAMAEHGREAVAANWRCQGPSGTVCKQKGVTDRPGWALAPPVGCDGLTSVFRHGADHAVALWVIGTRRRRHHQSFKQKLPPQTGCFVCIKFHLICLRLSDRGALAADPGCFDLRRTALLWRYVIPRAQTKSAGGLLPHRGGRARGRCDDAYAYASDVFRYGSSSKGHRGARQRDAAIPQRLEVDQEPAGRVWWGAEQPPARVLYQELDPREVNFGILRRRWTRRVREGTVCDPDM
ncbi:Protein of unknown function [Gryllus bimaculatus]|nr:Protein of unknown function [Gryllus bimaculatus]